MRLLHDRQHTRTYISTMRSLLTVTRYWYDKWAKVWITNLVKGLNLLWGREKLYWFWERRPAWEKDNNKRAREIGPAETLPIRSPTRWACVQQFRAVEAVAACIVRSARTHSNFIHKLWILYIIPILTCNPENDADTETIPDSDTDASTTWTLTRIKHIVKMISIHIANPLRGTSPSPRMASLIMRSRLHRRVGPACRAHTSHPTNQEKWPIGVHTLNYEPEPGADASFSSLFSFSCSRSTSPRAVSGYRAVCYDRDP